MQTVGITRRVLALQGIHPVRLAEQAVVSFSDCSCDNPGSSDGHDSMDC